MWGRVDPSRRRVCHDRGPARPCGLGASRSAPTGGVRPPPPPPRGREPGRAPLRGAAAHEAEGRGGARGGGADRVGPPTGWHRLRQIGDELVAGVEQFLLVDNVVAVEDGAALVAGQEHGDPLGDVRADQVAGGRTPVIVEEAGRHPTWGERTPFSGRGGLRMVTRRIADVEKRLAVAREELTLVTVQAEAILATPELTVGHEAVTA